MNTTIEEIDGKYVATLEGEMDTAAAIEAEQVLKPIYNSNGKDIIIDCTGLEYIASSGLRILLSILKGAKANGSRVVMRGVNEDIKNVFKLTGLELTVEMRDTYVGKYNNAIDELKRRHPPEKGTPIDIQYKLELVSSDFVNYEYLVSLIQKYINSCDETKVYKQINDPSINKYINI